MADREAKLSLILELLNAGKVADALAVVKAEIKQGGEAAEKTAGQFDQAAAATDKLDDAQSGAAASAAKEASALQDAGAAAEESGGKTSQAAQETQGALEGVTHAVDEERAAIAAAGVEAVRSGADQTRAAGEVEGAVQKLTQEWKAATDEAKALGQIDLDTAVGAVKELTTQIRSSGDSLETQKAALKGIESQLVEEFDKVTDAAKSQGTETTAQAKIIESALTDVRTKIAEVEAGLREVGPAGREGGDEATSSFLSVAEALEFANQAAADAQTKLEETGRVPKAEIRELAEIIETVSIAMERAAGTSEAATEVQLANTEQLKQKLGELTEITARQTNASADNAGALKESGNQVQALTGALGGLIGVTGNSSTIFGTAVQKIGAGASAYERAKDAVKTLDLNTLSLNKSWAAAGAQGALVAGTFIAGAAAGTKLAQANEYNRQVIDDFSKSLSKFKDDVLAGAISRIGGMQSALQNMAASASAAIAELNAGNFDGVSGQLDDLKQDSIGLGIAMEQGADAAKVYYQLLNAGFDDVSAMKAVTQEAEEAAQLFRLAHEQGGRSIILWNEAVKNSGNTAAGLARELKILKQDLEEEGRILALIEIEKKKYADKTRDQEDATKKHTAALRENQIAQREASDATVQASIDGLLFEKAINGSSEKVNILTRTIRDLIPASDENSIALKTQASALQEVVDKLDGLSAAQRRRIEEVIELSARGNELTEADRLYVAQLTTSIENGNRAVATTQERTAATEELTDALAALSEAEIEMQRIEAERILAVQAELEVIDQLIAAKERQQGVNREQVEINMHEGASLDYLRMRQAALTEQLEPQITIWKASAAAKDVESAAIKLLADITERQGRAIESVGASQSKITKIMEDGKAVYTNITEAQRQAAESGEKVAVANSNITKNTDAATAAMKALEGTVPNVVGTLETLRDIGEQVEGIMERVAISIRKANDAAASAAEGVGAVQ